MGFRLRYLAWVLVLAAAALPAHAQSGVPSACVGCDFRGSDLHGRDLRDVSWVGADLHGANLRNTQLCDRQDDRRACQPLTASMLRDLAHANLAGAEGI